METAEITKAEFVTRFKAAMRRYVGEAYDENYVSEIAPTYWDDPAQREDGPEQCAEAEASEWGEE